ncbi:TPA: hypothetical protein DDX46_01940 [Candidatus Saccharibacteria bacterium]|nr:MAG: membrane protein of unknown function [Candidatus Saccharibacteria bacterium GW2011_GWC2_44_17]MBH1956242.1 hypothetical protein [Candidatus Saccharibacteria bacterium]OGL23445.1 MAG: hypothetical protein A2791_01190 [Candidatus Saccharibacteria bacterium RIFCSPHIGHO2_01_FULL_46_30]OGL33992.1 MAG: hypothetical protein A3E20_05245 [Candidatus Saccharibacteria bacterium RIFCSPHIGHO2_12_FULL_47_16]MBH1972630.1 hypothetical protein [Candidatus Saccharibacteria bacterium]
MAQTQKQLKKKRPRTYARNRALVSRRGNSLVLESDGQYFLKLVCVVILGTLWLKLSTPVLWLGLPLGGIPLGTIIGLVGIKTLEKNQLNRKIWYAALIIVTIICYFVPAGIVL